MAVIGTVEDQQAFVVFFGGSGIDVADTSYRDERQAVSMPIEQASEASPSP